MDENFEKRIEYSKLIGVIEAIVENEYGFYKSARQQVAEIKKYLNDPVRAMQELENRVKRTIDKHNSDNQK